MASNVSSISQAFARNTASINIPNPPTIRDNRSKDSGVAFPAMFPGKAANTGLPTPPNSISPNLPAHGLTARAAKEGAGRMTPPSQVDSDIDLQDAMDHANGDGHGYDRDGGVPDAYGDITPALVAQNYLPDILLGKGPIAIRHAMNQLSKNLPGFSDIPPAKARRIVVAALEGRAGAGQPADIEFEKVGWGRWLAKPRTQPVKDFHRPSAANRDGKQAYMKINQSADGPTAAVSIPGMGKRPGTSARRPSRQSWTTESATSSRSDPSIEHMGMDIMENDADRMSVDGDHDSPPEYYVPQAEEPIMDQASFSDTDEEDWGSMGAAALRTGTSHGSNSYLKAFSGRRRSRHRSPYGRSAPQAPLTGHRSCQAQQNHGYQQTPPASLPEHHQTRARPMFPPLDFTGVNADSQEREAIEALMRMGSM